MLSDVPKRPGYVEALGGVSRLAGPFARVEGGYLIPPALGLFGFGEWNATDPRAGFGARWVF